MRKITSFFVLVAFGLTCIMPPQGFAQTISAVGLMPMPGTQAGLSPVFTPAHLKGMVINPNDPFKFDFLIYRGDAPLTQEQKKAEYARLIKYFLASLAVPDTDQWVNLSPYEKDRIIPGNFGSTAMGRDLLAQDYLLKQISASLTNPDTDLGKKFWDGVYAQAYQKFGTTAIPTDTFNKVWITPDKAVVYEKGNSVVVLEHHLKVMLEKDYLATHESKEVGARGEDNETAAISHKVMRAVIIPAIEKEVNEGKNFAPLRQVYSGMLLASWYKLALKESILGKLYADKSKVKGIDQDPKNNQEIYNQYVQAFRKGVFNMIKEDTDHYTQEVIPRKYFSGGAVNNEKDVLQRLKGASGRADDAQGALEKVDLAEATLADASPTVLANKGNIVFYDGKFIQDPLVLHGFVKYSLLGKGIPAIAISVNPSDRSIQIIEITSSQILQDAELLGLPVAEGNISLEHIVNVYAQEGALIVKVEDTLSPTGAYKYTFRMDGVTRQADSGQETLGEDNAPVVQLGVTREVTDGIVSGFLLGADNAEMGPVKKCLIFVAMAVLSFGAGVLAENNLFTLNSHETSSSVNPEVPFSAPELPESQINMLSTWNRLKNENKVNDVSSFTLDDGKTIQLGGPWLYQGADGPIPMIINRILVDNENKYWLFISTRDKKVLRIATNGAVENFTQKHGKIIDHPPAEQVDMLIAILSLQNKNKVHEVATLVLDDGKRIGVGELWNYNGIDGTKKMTIDQILVENDQKIYWLYLSSGVDGSSERIHRIASGNATDPSQAKSLADDLKAGWDKDHPQGPGRNNLYDLWKGRQAEERDVTENINKGPLSSGDDKKSDKADERRPGQGFVHAPQDDGLDLLDISLLAVGAVLLTRGGDGDLNDINGPGNEDNAENIKGGIDFARSNLTMQIKRDGAGVPLPVSQQDLDSIHINGLVPVILNIRPAAGVPLFSETGKAAPQAA